MAADGNPQTGAAAGHFGACCETLREAMSGGEFEPLVSEGEDGVLYMSVGLIDIEEDEPAMVEFPVYFCPFCGKGLQTVEEVDQKSKAAAQA